MPLLSSAFTSGIRQQIDDNINAIIFGVGDFFGAGISKVANFAGSALEGASDIIDRGASRLADAVTPSLPALPSDNTPSQAVGIAMEGPSLSPQSMTQVAAISQACQNISMQDCSLSQLGSGLEAPTFAMNHDFYQKQQSAGVGMMA